MNEVIVFDSPVFIEIKSLLNGIQDTIEQQHAELRELKTDYLMTSQQVIEFTGCGKDWLEAHRDEIGWTKMGGAYRFLRSNLDAYIAKCKGGIGVKNLHIKRS